jgi:hypothetical protein
MMVWMAMWFALAGPTGESPQAQFMREFQAGADCPRLFDLRNAAKPDIPAERQEEMNRPLRSVQCFSSTSKRAARSTSEPDGFTVTDYRIYRSVVDTPISVSETRALQDAATRYGVTAAEARKATESRRSCPRGTGSRSRRQKSGTRRTGMERSAEDRASKPSASRSG